MIRRRIAPVYGGISAAVTGTRLAVRQINYNSEVRHGTRPEDIVKEGRYMRHSPADLATIFGAVRTARLVLRRLQESDGLAFFAMDGDSATHRYTPTGPAPDIASSEQRLRGWLEQWKEEGYSYWAAILPQAEQILGVGGIRRGVWRERDVLNLYYRFTPSAWGGKATRPNVFKRRWPSRRNIYRRGQ
jgi:GNAT acetyltransferase-like protein